jgi:hypothetical protein
MVRWRTVPARLAAARRQLVPAAAAGLGGPVQPGHGGNDAQKTIGIIWMLLIAAATPRRRQAAAVWVIWVCYVAIGLGTMFGGWRIVKTMGQKITKLKPVGGFCAENGRRDHALPRDGARRAGVDDPHHHRAHRRRRLRAARVGGRWGVPATSSGPGSSRSRRRPSSRGLPTGSACCCQRERRPTG